MSTLQGKPFSHPSPVVTSRMPIEHGIRELDGTRLVRVESDHLRLDIAPTIGGRIVSLVGKSTGHEFLWRNTDLPLRAVLPGTEYDPNFFGGIDELLPNDIPERIDGVDCPDHGELWTAPLDSVGTGDGLKLSGTLPLTGLVYEKELALRAGSPHMDTSPLDQWRKPLDTMVDGYDVWNVYSTFIKYLNTVCYR